MIRLVSLEDAEEDFRTPTQLARFALAARQVARHHQTSLRHPAELPFHQLRTAQRRVQVLFRFRPPKTVFPLRERQLLEASQGEQETVVVDCDQRVAADPVLHPPGHDARKRVVRAPPDEGVKKVVERSPSR